MAGKVRTIEIAYCDQTITTEAYVSGKFATHPPDGSPLKSWKPGAWYAITHVATGRKVTEMQGRDAARALARKLDALLPMDFTADDFSGEWSELYAAFATDAKRVVKEAQQ